MTTSNKPFTVSLNPSVIIARTITGNKISRIYKHHNRFFTTKPPFYMARKSMPYKATRKNWLLAVCFTLIFLLYLLAAEINT
jgi:hypothetical protein